MSRPRKEIDKKDFESLMAIQCTLDEASAFFSNKLDGCSPDTIERWCEREYGKPFAEIAREKRNVGKISLRRSQFELAKKNAAMAIFLGKNYLGQSDDPQRLAQSKATEDRLGNFIDALSDMASKIDGD